MQEKIRDWTYEDCLAFMLINAASANQEVNEEELEVIHEKVSEAAFKRAKKFFDKCNDYECIEVMLELQKKFFPSSEQKSNLLKDLKEIVAGEDYLNEMEENFLNQLERLMD